MTFYPSPKPERRPPRAPTRMRQRNAKREGAAFPHTREPELRRFVKSHACLLAGKVTHCQVTPFDEAPTGRRWRHVCFGPVDPAHVGEHDARGVGDVNRLVPLCRAAHHFYDNRRHQWESATEIPEAQLRRVAEGLVMKFIECGGVLRGGERVTVLPCDEKPARQNVIERTFAGALVCRRYRRTWAFPREVAELLQRETAGQSVLHLFGGQATWGLKLDGDRTTRPAVVGNAFFPPFRCESFDVVIADPPYTRGTNGLWAQVLAPAACLARTRVWWFSTYALDVRFHGLRLLRWFAVVPSKQGELRYLAELERTRHPHGGCSPTPRHGQRKLASPIRRFDWRSRIEQPNFALEGA